MKISPVNKDCPMKKFFVLMCVFLLLGAADPDTRYHALAVLGWIGPAAKEFVPQVLKALEEKNDGVRFKAAFALGRIGADPKVAIRPLLKLLTEPNAEVRRAAGES